MLVFNQLYYQTDFWIGASWRDRPLFERLRELQFDPFGDDGPQDPRALGLRDANRWFGVHVGV